MVDINPTGQSLHAKSYITQFDMAIQQTKSKLEPYVEQSVYSANAEKRQVAVRYGETKMSQITGIADSITHEELSSVQRWMVGSAWDVAHTYNEFLQGQLTEQRIRDAIVMAQMAAMQRQKDEVILNALFADTLSGTDGTSTTAYDSNNTIAASVGAGANTGLNIAKFEALKEKMQLNEVDVDGEIDSAVAVLTEKSHTDLRKLIEVNNSDYRSQYGVVTDKNGNISKFYGFDIVVFSTARLAKYASSARLLNGALRRIPVFTKKAIQLGTWAANIQDVTILKDKKGHPLQFYTAMNFGACRGDEKLVYDIQVTE
jgi:hypothetical protein